MSMPLVPCSRLEHGPTDHMISAGGFFIDQELHLHVDPAILTLEACDLRHVVQVATIHFCAACRRARRGNFSVCFTIALHHPVTAALAFEKKFPAAGSLHAR